MRSPQQPSQEGHRPRSKQRGVDGWQGIGCHAGHGTQRGVGGAFNGSCQLQVGARLWGGLQHRAR